MSEEIELKLVVAPKDLARLRQNPLLRTLASGRRARRQELESTYFDTPERQLKHHGMALRIRKQGRRLIQTLKMPVAGDRNGTLRRMREVEGDVESQVPDLGAIGDAELGCDLDLPALQDQLEPLFTTKVVRYVLPVRLMQCEVEVAFDEGTLIAGKQQEAISEVELELLSGDPEYLIQLALAIGEKTSYHLEPRSKAARGYALATGQILPPVFAERPDLPVEASAAEAFTLIARDCIKQIRANEASLLSGCRDPETVHQLRVGVRRLRAAVSLFQPLIAEGVGVQLREGLKWLQNVLGPARDWDVFRLETLDAIAARLPGERGIARLAKAADQQREEAQVAAQAALRTHSYATLLLRLELWLRNGAWRAAEGIGESGSLPSDRPAADFAKEALAARAVSLLKKGKKRDETVEESLHDLRISGKKLRYALEFLRVYLDKDQAKQTVSLTKELQDCLGSLNDAAVSRGLLKELQERHPKAVEPRALGLVLGWQGQRVEHDLGKLERVWERAKPIFKGLT